MEVIVNNHQNLIVKDKEGNVLFQWLPAKHTGGFVGNINIKTLNNPDVKEIADSIERELRKASTTYI